MTRVLVLAEISLIPVVQPIIRTPLPSGYLSLKSLRVMTFPPTSVIFFAAISEIEKAQTVNLWSISPDPRTLPGTTMTSPFLVTDDNLEILTSLLIDLAFEISCSRDLQIEVLFFLKAFRKAHTILPTKVLENIVTIPSLIRNPQINLPRSSWLKRSHDLIEARHFRVQLFHRCANCFLCRQRSVGFNRKY